MAIPKGVERKHVLEAIRLFDSGEAHLFADSTKFDLIFNERRYPPKAIFGLAGQVATGEQFGPNDFSGGTGSACFDVLKKCGFLIELKNKNLASN